MTNGKLDEAEIDALLSGERDKVDRYLITGIQSLQEGQGKIQHTMRSVLATCEKRGESCPGMHPEIALEAARKCAAIKVKETASKTAGELERRQTWLMWLVGTKLAYIVLIVAIFCVETAINYWWFGAPEH